MRRDMSELAASGLLKVRGRCGKEEGALVLFWQGSGPEIRFRGSSIKAEMDAEYGNLELWLDVFVDGERLSRFPLSRERREYTLVQNLDPMKETVVRIARNTQNMPEDSVSLIRIYTLDVDGEILTPPSYKYSLEFIGDSITSGEGCGLTNREEWIPAVFDNANSYSCYTADLLNAEYSIVSQSGWGLYASWDGNPACNIPDVYPRLCGSQRSERGRAIGCQEPWDFASAQKDAVIINLGTNDQSAMGTGKWEKEEYEKLFRAQGIRFLKELRGFYPQAHLVWAYGMLGREMQDLIREFLEEYKKETGDQKVSFLLLPDSAPDYLGVRFHPTPEGHKMAAKVLEEYLKSILG